MIRNLISSQLKILSLSLSLSLSIYIYIYILFYHVFLHILRHNFFFFFFYLPIINNSYSFTIFMLFRNLTLLFFPLLLRLFDVFEIHSRTLYQTYNPNYSRYVCFYFVLCFIYLLLLYKF